MDKFVIEGKIPLQGEVEISGSKNAALPVLTAALLVDGPCRIESVPDIADAKVLLKIIELLGATVEHVDKNAVIIDSTTVNTSLASGDYATKMRASYYLLGALLGSRKSANVPLPGGCNFGIRPIDQHLKGFERLGAKIIDVSDAVVLEAENLTGTTVYMDVVSVGATINIILAAVKAEGTTTIENAAKEPHVVDVANFLNAMGANIKGAGTDVVRIKGVERLPGGYTHTIIPDQIEAGTYMIAAAATRGNVLIKNIIPTHMEALTAKMIEMGVKIEEYEDSIRVIADNPLKGVKVHTMPHPGFATDLQPLMTALLCIAEGRSQVNESVWEDRFQYIGELRRLGAKIDIVGGNTAIIQGTESFKATKVTARDLRAGAALVVAALASEGTAEVYEVRYIDRGYEHFVEKLKAIGAKIERKSDT